MAYILPQNVKHILSTFERKGFSAFVVGGAVRSMLMGAPVKDWDIVTTAPPETTKLLFKKHVTTGEAYGTITVLLDGGAYEVTSARSEGNYADNRHPYEVDFGKKIEEDLARRDFTMNAIAYDGMFFTDPYGGTQDIENKIIRCVGTAAERFEEDALRILRAFRFAATLGFAIEEETLKAATLCAPSLRHISKERVRNELQKILFSNAPSAVEPLVTAGGLASFGISGIKRKHFFFASINHIPANMLLRWWAFAKITNTNIEVLCHSMQFSKSFMQAMLYTEKMFRDLQPTTLKQMKYFLKNGTPAVAKDLFKAFATLDKKYEQQLSLVYELESNKEPYKKSMLAVSGGDLFAHGIQGKRVGKTLNFLVDTVIETPKLNKYGVLVEIAKKASLIL